MAGGARFTTHLSGSTGAQVRVFRFENVPAKSNSALRASAEVRLHEGTHLIEVHYGGTTVSPQDYSATVGFQATTNEGFDLLGCSPNCTFADWPAGHILAFTP